MQIMQHQKANNFLMCRSHAHGQLGPVLRFILGQRCSINSSQWNRTPQRLQEKPTTFSIIQIHQIQGSTRIHKRHDRKRRQRAYQGNGQKEFGLYSTNDGRPSGPLSALRTIRNSMSGITTVETQTIQTSVFLPFNSSHSPIALHRLRFNLRQYRQMVHRFTLAQASTDLNGQRQRLIQTSRHRKSHHDILKSLRETLSEQSCQRRFIPLRVLAEHSRPESEVDRGSKEPCMPLERERDIQKAELYCSQREGSHSKGDDATREPALHRLPPSEAQNPSGRKSEGVYLSSRHGVWVLQRLAKGGLPFDLEFIRRFPNWINNILPAAVSRWMLKKYMNDQFNHELYNIQPEGIAWKEPLVNEELPSRILSGSIMVKPHVTKFTETSVHFADGSVVDNLDVVLLATGYDYSFPFLDEAIVKKDETKGSFYKKIVPLGIEKPTIAFISFVLPIGPTMVVAELQSRWATKLFKGLHKLPSSEGIKNEMLKDERLRKKWFATADNNFRRTDYIPYMDDLASDIGVKLNIWKLFLKDPVLAWKVVFGPCNSYQFRLTGPGKWVGAREAILTQWHRIEKPLKTRVVSFTTSGSDIKNFTLLFFLPWDLIPMLYNLHKERKYNQFVKHLRV
ncbi:unnamed protein product [Ranitomeya imitator]|uniref:Flavin-containing monooxygenase n=1 Tax=Ranitomeya imitator TaxID=111125 RepID=A0ABN9LH26_9NEOB|nr:unnamed protein product [Ranitomeya imitator]